MSRSCVCGVIKAQFTSLHCLPLVLRESFTSFFAQSLNLVLRNRQSTFSPLTPFLPLPKYFESEWSYAQYRIPVRSSHIALSSSTRPSEDDFPDEERCVVGWIRGPPEDALQPSNTPNYQLIALTFTGGWYRLALPRLTSTLKATGSPTLGASPLPASPPRTPNIRPPRSVSGSSAISRLDKGKEKEKEREKDNKESRDCTLKEYRRYGRWDGWGWLSWFLFYHILSWIFCNYNLQPLFWHFCILAYVDLISPVHGNSTCDTRVERKLSHTFYCNGESTCRTTSCTIRTHFEEYCESWNTFLLSFLNAS
jgi:hypothetical protein